MGMNLINFGCNFAQNIANNSQNIIGIYLVDLPQFDESVVVVDICADSLLDCLELR